MYFIKKLCAEVIDHVGILRQELFIEVVFVVSSLFFRLNNACFCQNLNVVADGWLREFNNIIDLSALSTTALFGDVLEDPQTIRIA